METKEKKHSSAKVPAEIYVSFKEVIKSKGLNISDALGALMKGVVDGKIDLDIKVDLVDKK